MQTQELNEVYKWGKIVLIVLTVFLGISALGSLKALRDAPPVYNSITVTGEGETFAIPDLATFSFSVSSDKATVSAAQEEVTQKMDKILKALKDQGIEEKDIQTTDYSVYPKYSYTSMPCTQFSCPPSRQVQEGYTANHSVTVKVRKADMAGQALAVAGDNGASNLSGISFTVDDPQKLKDEARAMAIKEARAKAESLSKELGVKLVKVISFYDNSDAGVPPYPYGMGGDVVALEAKAPTLPTGENKVKVVVNVTYEIR
ncbi:MAG TPA: SIMPL domain-containing protein [Candidatus Paceibacterota bacterium]